MGTTCGIRKSKQLFIVVFVVACILLLGCGSDVDNTIVKVSPSLPVIVYGRDSCGITTAMKSALENESIAYVYKNIDIASNSKEMWNKVRATSWYQGGSVKLPVVDVKGTVLERPSIEDVKSELGSP